MAQRHVVAALAISICAIAASAFAQSTSEAHLLAGAKAFRSGQFEAALVEFKVARQLGARGGVSWYVAATLTRLERTEDALDAFAQAQLEAPEARDALLDYYRAIACYDANLLACADAILAGVGAQAGPRIAAQAEKIRSDLAAVLKAEPPASAIDALITRAQRATARPALAALFLEEATALSSRRADHYRREQLSRPQGGPDP